MEGAVVEQQPHSKLKKLLIEDRKTYVVVRSGGEIVKAPNNVMSDILTQTRWKELLRYCKVADRQTPIFEVRVVICTGS